MPWVAGNGSSYSWPSTPMATSTVIFSGVQNTSLVRKEIEMALTKEDKKILEDIRDSQVEQRTVLLGIPDTDDRGLVGEVKDIKLNVSELGSSHGKLKRNFWLLIGTLAGSGAIFSSSCFLQCLYPAHKTIYLS